MTDSDTTGALVAGGDSDICDSDICDSDICDSDICDGGIRDGGIRDGGNCEGSRILTGALGIAWSIAGMAM